MLLVLLMGCSKDSPMPSIAFLTPLDGDRVCGLPLEVDIDVQNFALGSEEVDGLGHIDFSLNGQEVTMTHSTTFSLPDVDDGLYQLQAELVRSDHTSIEPYTGETIYVTVDNALCTP